MSTDHPNPAATPSERLLVGDCMVDLSLREILAPASHTPQRVTIKTINVLICLATHAGKVVTREELLKSVWPHTTPTDDVVTQAIAQLRRALGDEQARPQYIDTISKQGYRLLAPVHWLKSDVANTPFAAPAVEPAGAAERHSSRLDQRLLLLGSTAIFLVLLLALRLWPGQDVVGHQATSASAAGNAGTDKWVRLTSTAGPEVSPSLSPDGNMLVYSRVDDALGGAQLIVQSATPAAGRPHTPLIKGQYDGVPAWSPDGRGVAFIRTHADGSCRLMLAPAMGGEPRELAICLDDKISKFGWHPDGLKIVASATRDGGSKPAAIHILDLDSGRWRPLKYSRQSSDYDLTPAYSPDGKWIAFQRNLSIGDLWRMPSAGGSPERLTSLKSNFYGLTWTPDSRSIVFGRYLDARFELSLLNVETRRVESLGVQHAVSPSIALKAPSLAFAVVREVGGIYRIRGRSNPSDAPHEPVRIFPSTGVESLPSIAPDGRQVIFMSDRSGETRLWWADLQRTASLRMVNDLTPVVRFPVSWSADSHRVLALAEGGNLLYEVTAGSGRRSRLEKPNGVFVHAAYHPDPALLLAGVDRGSGRLDLVLYDRTVQPIRAIQVLTDVARFWVDASRSRIVFVRQSQAGLFSAGLNLKGIAVLHPMQSFVPVTWRRLIITPEAIWFLARDKKCGLRRTSLWPHEDPGECLGAVSGDITGVSYSPREDEFYLSSEDRSESDIGWIRLKQDQDRPQKAREARGKLGATP